MNYIDRDTLQLKANLHSHSKLSDGVLTVDELIAAYKAHGYSVLAITDHEAPYDHTDKSDDELMLLTGYEAYIRPSEMCRMDPFGPEIHLNLFACDPHNVSFIGYDPHYVKYMPPETAAERPKYGTLGKRQFTREYIQKFIDEAREAGYLVSCNHPVWSMQDEQDVLALDGFFSLEIFNHSSQQTCGFESNLALYSKMLSLGKFPGVHGADDNHNFLPLDDFLSDSFGAWTMILADDFTYTSVIQALKDRRFYASTGPMIHELRFEGSHVHLAFSDARRVIMHITPKRCVNYALPDGGTFGEADFEIPDYARWVHFSVIAADGTMAHTRAFTREELDI